MKYSYSLCWFRRLIFSGLILMGSAGFTAERANVLFISIDDLNDWIGCLQGHPQTLTPNIDLLAKRGVLFANAHCASPACNPSRAAVYSGLRPDRTGVWSNDSPKLPAHRPEIELLPKTFERAGYATLGTGKLLHGSGAAARALFQKGFYPEQRWSPLSREAVEYTADELPSKSTDTPRHAVRRAGRDPVVLPLNGMPSDRNPQRVTGESFDWGPMDVDDREMGDTQITNWASSRLQDGGSQPFFMGVGYYRPHIPLWAPRKYFKPFQQSPVHLPAVLPHDLDDLSSTGRQWAREPVTAGAHKTVLRFGQWEEAVQGYLACVHYVDHEVGRLLKALDNSSEADNTWIFLWSDHGWHLGEKQHWGKWTGWERSTRVPLMIVPPTNQRDEFQTGSVCQRPVNLLDLFPTLMDVCKLKPPHPLAGRSLRPLLVDPQAESDRSSVTLFDRGNVAVRLNDSRYIRYANGDEEFYDHTRDPNEWYNVIANRDFGERVQQARVIADNILQP